MLIEKARGREQCWETDDGLNQRSLGIMNKDNKWFQGTGSSNGRAPVWTMGGHRIITGSILCRSINFPNYLSVEIV